jgi:hypothetical protein
MQRFNRRVAVHGQDEPVDIDLDAWIDALLAEDDFESLDTLLAKRTSGASAKEKPPAGKRLGA